MTVTREQAIAELKRRQELPKELSTVTREQAIAELRKRELEQPKEYSLWDRAKQIGHGAKSGIASLPLAAVEHTGKGQENLAPAMPGMEEYQSVAPNPELEKWAQKKQKKYSTPLGNDALAKILHKGGEWGGSMALPLPGGATLKGAASGAKTIAKGFGLGAGAGTLEAAGLPPWLADLTAIGVQPTASIIKNSGIKHRLAGLGPNKINMRLADAAARQGIDLPAATLSTSPHLELAHKVVGKTPVVGDILNTKHEKASQKVKDLLGDIKQSIGPEQNEAWEATKKALYQKEHQGLPEMALVRPNELVEKLTKMRKQMRSLSPHPDEKVIQKELDDLIEKIKPGAFVRDLIDSKKSFHMKYPDINAGTKNYRKAIARAIGEEIETYGKSTPEAKEWFKHYQEAQEHYGQGARRKKFDKMLGDVGGKSEEEGLHYKTLFNKLANKDNQKRLEAFILPKSHQGNIMREKLSDLATLSEGMANAKARLHAPSPTAQTSEAIKFVKQIGTLGAVGGAALMAPVTSIASMGVLSYLVTSKKLVNSAIKFAKKPSDSLARRLNHIAKEETGLALPILNDMFGKD